MLKSVVRDGAVRNQRTLRNPIGCVGTGLHTGAKVSLTLHPAEPDSGVRFVRYDRPGGSTIPARFDQVCDTTMCTALGDAAGRAVGSVEHLMAALAICEIDNVLVEASGPELPIMDGSAQPFVFLIECAGIIEQARPRRRIEVLKPVSVAAHGKYARLEPASRADPGLRGSPGASAGRQPGDVSRVRSGGVQELRSPAPAPSASPSGWRNCGRMGSLGAAR